MWSATEIRHAGFRSLGLRADGVSTYNPGYARVRPPSSLGAGLAVTAQVYVDSSSTSVTARAYIQDATWKWVAMGPVTSLGPWRWTQVTVTVPSTASMPLRNVGLQFMTRSGAYSGNLYVDDVLWDGGSGGGGSALRYGFETGTEGWVNLERCTRLWSADNVRVEGVRSLGLWLEYASGSAPGYARVRPDASLAGGRTATMQVYVDAAAANVVGRLYVQDATWRWVAMSPVVSLGSRAWTTLSLAVPTSVALPVQNLGLQIMTRSGTGSYRGAVHVDNVRW